MELALLKWQTFFYLCGSSAAALTGLMFIAITFGADLVREDNLDPVHAFFTSIAIHFFQTFLICCVAVMPDLDVRIFASIIFLSVGFRFSRVPKQYRVMKTAGEGNSNIDASDWTLNLILPSVIYVAMLTSAILIFENSPYALYVLAFAMTALIVTGMRAAWDILVWTAQVRRRYAADGAASEATSKLPANDK